MPQRACLRSAQPRRVFVLGAPGTIGRATVHALVDRGHEVVCLVQRCSGVGGALAEADSARLLSPGPLDAVIAVLGTAGRVLAALAAKALPARIGRFYATESMLLRDPETGLYDAAAPCSAAASSTANHASLVGGQ